MLLHAQTQQEEYNPHQNLIAMRRHAWPVVGALCNHLKSDPKHKNGANRNPDGTPSYRRFRHCESILGGKQKEGIPFLLLVFA